MTSGKAVILSGPSGVGKDTVIDAWIARNPRVRRVVTYTTRSPRNGEVDGVDYHFVDDNAFQSLVKAGKFLEWKQVHKFWYASPLDDLREMVSNGDIAILKIDVQGAIDAMPKLKGEITVFLMPPSMEALEARIRGRKTDSEEQIALRLQTAREEMKLSHRYQHIVINDSVERAVNELEAIVA